MERNKVRGSLSKVGLKSLPKSQSQSFLKAQTPLDGGLQTRHGGGCTSAPASDGSWLLMGIPNSNTGQWECLSLSTCA